MQSVDTWLDSEEWTGTASSASAVRCHLRLKESRLSTSRFRLKREEGSGGRLPTGWKLCQTGTIGRRPEVSVPVPDEVGSHSRSRVTENPSPGSIATPLLLFES